MTRAFVLRARRIGRSLGLEGDRAGHAEGRGRAQDRARREKRPGEDVDVAARTTERVGANLAAAQDDELDRVGIRPNDDVAALAEATLDARRDLPIRQNQ